LKGKWAGENREPGRAPKWREWTVAMIADVLLCLERYAIGDGKEVERSSREKSTRHFHRGRTPFSGPSGIGGGVRTRRIELSMSPFEGERSGRSQGDEGNRRRILEGISEDQIVTMPPRLTTCGKGGEKKSSLKGSAVTKENKAKKAIGAWVRRKGSVRFKGELSLTEGEGPEHAQNFFRDE